MTVPTAEDFDAWYEAIIDSPGWDPFVRRGLDLPPQVESTGYLAGPGARAAAARFGLTERARFAPADLADTGLPDATADAILCVDAFHFADSIPAAATEVVRLLKPGGRLVITTREPADPDAAKRLPERIARMHIDHDLRAAGLVALETLERPDWACVETAFWAAAARLDAVDDPALAGLRDEAREFLPLADALRRLLVVARR